MRDYRVPPLLALGGLLMGLALLLATQPYSVSRPWAHFDEPAHRYLVAALRRDSSGLERLSATPQPVHWAIRTEQTERGTDACPFRLTFVGQERPRLVRAHARCYKYRGWPFDPSVIAIPRQSR
jgi:hypothetical protein